MTDYKYNIPVNDSLVCTSSKKNTVLLDEVEIMDTVIVSDCYGNNQVKVTNDLKMEEFDNIFQRTLLKIQEQKGSQQQTIDEYLNTKRKDLYDKLETARINFNLQQFTKAIDLYEIALQTIENDSYPDEFRLRENDILAIKYALALCNLGLNTQGSLTTACDIMSVLLECGLKFPKFYYLLANIKFNLFCFDHAKQMLTVGLNILKESFKLLELKWPTSHLVLIDSDKSKLEQNMLALLVSCSNVPLPNIKCRYLNCDADKNAIYFDSPSFNGYVNVICSENCNIYYHNACWKNKLKLSNEKNTKTLLNCQCITNDCAGFTKEISYYNKDLFLKSSIKSSNSEDVFVKGATNLFTDEPKNETPEIKKKFVIKTTLSRSHRNQNDPNARKADLLKGAISKPENLNKFATHNQHSSIRSPSPQSPTQQGYLFENNSSSLFINNSKLKPDVPEFLPKLSSPKNDLSPRPIVLPVISEYEQNNSAHHVQSQWPPYMPILRKPTMHELGMQKRLRPVTIAPETKQQGFQTDPVDTKSTETQIVIDIKEESTQTNCDSNKEINCLTVQIHTLSHELFECEDDYNTVLYKYKELQDIYNYSILHQHISSKANHGEGVHNLNEQIETFATSTQTDPSNESKNEHILDCLRKNTEYLNENATLTRLVEQLNKEKKELLNEINELKSTIRSERSGFAICAQKHQLELDHGKETIFDLKSKLSIIHAEYLACQNNKEVILLQNMLFKQIDNNKELYITYLSNMENKCKYMLWQLDEIKLLTVDNSSPSSNEIEENYQLWQKTLEKTEYYQQIIQDYFIDVCRKIEAKAFDQPILTGLPALISEPSNIIVHYFKSILTLNKKLEQDLSKNMLTFYKMMSLSMANMSQYQNNVFINEPTSQDIVVRKTVATPPGFSKKEFKPIPSTSKVEPPLLEVEPSTSADIQDNRDQYYIPSTSSPKPRLVNVNNISEDVPISTGALPKKQTPDSKLKKSKHLDSFSESLSPTSDASKPEQKPIQDVVGMDALLLKLQKSFPLCGVKTITDALLILRKRQGGLTGMTNKEIAIAIKKIIKENWPKEKSDEKKCATKTTQAWAKINNGVEWQNNNPDRNCTICFEVMDKKYSVQLTCQHLFHTNCIKKWLQTNSICPICRSFTRLDDEFPPLT